MRGLALIALVAAWPAAAQLFRDKDPDEPAAPWVELVVKPPAYPREEKLLQFTGAAAVPHRFFLDLDSLSVGEDGVVRYTLVVRSAGGATNVSFEGIRCDLRQNKIYAVGRRDGNWISARDPQWRNIDFRDANRPHSALHYGVLCQGREPVKGARDIVNNIRYGPKTPRTAD